jgi:hypothetical protein
LLKILKILNRFWTISFSLKLVYSESLDFVVNRLWSDTDIPYPEPIYKCK